MSIKRLLLRCFLSLSPLLAPAAARAYTTSYLEYLTFDRVGPGYTVAFNQNETAPYIVFIPDDLDGDPVWAIAEHGFENNSDMTNMLIPKNVQKIGDAAFAGCNRLIKVCSLALDPPSLGQGVFDEYTLRNELMVPAEAIDAYMAADGWKEFARIKPLPTAPEDLFKFTETADSSGWIIEQKNINNVIGHLEIPAEWQGKPVVELGIMRNGWVSSVSIPQTIKVIGTRAFLENFALTEIVLPDNVTEIGSFAFRRCGMLAGFKIPTGVRSIGSLAFSYTYRMGNIVLPDSIETIGTECFAFSRFESIVLPPSLVELCSGAFRESTFSSITFADGEEPVDIRGALLFENANFSDLYLGRPVKNKNASFYNLTLHSLTLGSSITSLENIPLGRTVSDKLRVLATTPPIAADTTFCQEMYERASLSVPYGTAEAYRAADCWKNFSEINELPPLVDDILTFTDKGNGWSVARKEGANIAGHIEIPAEWQGKPVIEIADMAFLNCSRLTGITIPSSVTTVGECAFRYCSSLTEVEFPSSITSINTSKIFDECSSLRRVVLPECVTEIAWGAFRECTNLSDLELPAAVKKFGTFAFDHCRSLGDFKLPPNLTYIGNQAFASAYFGNVTIPTSVKEIGSRALDLARFSSLTIADSPSPIYVDYTIRWNTNSLHIGRPMSRATSSFNDLSIDKLEFGPYVESLELMSLDATFAKQLIVMNETPPAATDSTFSEKMYSDAILIVPLSAVESYRNAEGWRNFANIRASIIDTRSPLAFIMNEDSTGWAVSATEYAADRLSLIIPESVCGIPVTIIDENAFSNCRSLEIIRIPETITDIRANAFDNCDNLAEIEIPWSVTSIGTWALANSALKRITICDSPSSDNDRPLFLDRHPIPQSFSGDIYVGRTLLADPIFDGFLPPELKEDMKEWEMYRAGNIIVGPDVTDMSGGFFANFFSINSLTVTSAIPPEVTTESFDSCIYRNTQLIVRADAAEAYRRHPVWSLFNSVTANDMTPESIELPFETLGLYTGRTIHVPSFIFPETEFNFLRWKSSDPTVATIDNNGHVTAIGAGSAILTAEVLGAVSQCSLTVVDAPTENTPFIGYSLEKADYVMSQGDFLTIPVTAYGHDDYDMSWSSSDPSVAPVSSNGSVFALKAGKATITVTLTPRATAEPAARSVSSPESIQLHTRVTIPEKTTGIDGTATAADTPCEIYDLRGIRVNCQTRALAPGCYIIRQNGQSRKIIVR